MTLIVTTDSIQGSHIYYCRLQYRPIWYF